MEVLKPGHGLQGSARAGKVSYKNPVRLNGCQKGMGGLQVTHTWIQLFLISSILFRIFSFPINFSGLGCFLRHNIILFYPHRIDSFS
jgi:hypothetical protein